MAHMSIWRGRYCPNLRARHQRRSTLSPIGAFEIKSDDPASTVTNEPRTCGDLVGISVEAVQDVPPVTFASYLVTRCFDSAPTRVRWTPPVGSTTCNELHRRSWDGTIESWHLRGQCASQANLNLNQVPASQESCAHSTIAEPNSRQIAGFCRGARQARIDALIAKVRKAIDHLREFRTALISAAVTGKIDVRATSAEATAGQGETR